MARGLTVGRVAEQPAFGEERQIPTALEPVDGFLATVRIHGKNVGVVQRRQDAGRFEVFQQDRRRLRHEPGHETGIVRRHHATVAIACRIEPAADAVGEVTLAVRGLGGAQPKETAFGEETVGMRGIGIPADLALRLLEAQAPPVVAVAIHPLRGQGITGMQVEARTVIGGRRQQAGIRSATGQRGKVDAERLHAKTLPAVRDRLAVGQVAMAVKPAIKEHVPADLAQEGERVRQSRIAGELQGEGEVERGIGGVATRPLAAGVALAALAAGEVRPQSVGGLRAARHGVEQRGGDAGNRRTARLGFDQALVYAEGDQLGELGGGGDVFINAKREAAAVLDKAAGLVPVGEQGAEAEQHAAPRRRLIGQRHLRLHAAELEGVANDRAIEQEHEQAEGIGDIVGGKLKAARERALQKLSPRHGEGLQVLLLTCRIVALEFEAQFQVAATGRRGGTLHLHPQGEQARLELGANQRMPER